MYRPSRERIEFRSCSTSGTCSNLSAQPAARPPVQTDRRERWKCETQQCRMAESHLQFLGLPPCRKDGMVSLLLQVVDKCEVILKCLMKGRVLTLSHFLIVMMPKTLIGVDADLQQMERVL